MVLVIHRRYPTICQSTSHLKNKTPPTFHIRYCLVGIAIIGLGVIYWAVWRIVLPKIFGYELVPTKVVLGDGTIVNVVRSFFSFFLLL